MMMEMLVQKSTSTTFPRSPSAESGGEFNQVVAPRSADNPRSAVTPIACSTDFVAPNMASSDPARVAAAVARKRRRSRLMGTGRLLDPPRHDRRVRQERHMARLDLRRMRLGTLGIEALEIGIDGAVVLRDQVPGRNRLPCRLIDRRTEDVADDRLLCRGRDPCFTHRQVGGKDVAELRRIDPEETRGVRLERRAE